MREVLHAEVATEDGAVARCVEVDGCSTSVGGACSAAADVVGPCRPLGSVMRNARVEVAVPDAKMWSIGQ